MDSVRAMLLRAGAPPSRIKVESFTPARQPPATKPPEPTVEPPRKPGGLVGLLRSIIRRM
jgi:hypothetical protein